MGILYFTQHSLTMLVYIIMSFLHTAEKPNLKSISLFFHRVSEYWQGSFTFQFFLLSVWFFYILAHWNGQIWPFSVLFSPGFSISLNFTTIKLFLALQKKLGPNLADNTIEGALIFIIITWNDHSPFYMRYPSNNL